MGTEITYKNESYFIREKLGSGGFGSVYKVESNAGKTFAIKILNKDKGILPQNIINEYNIQASLNHPDIIKIYNIAQSNNFFLMLMEYNEGQDLAAIRQNAKLTINDLKNILNCIVPAIQYCESRGVYHFDIKPDNIFKYANNRYKLFDFGIAVLLKNRKCVGVNIDEYKDKPVGTDLYIAPEIFLNEGIKNNQEKQLTKIHSYALGVTLLNLITDATEDYSIYLDQSEINAFYNVNTNFEKIAIVTSSQYKKAEQEIQNDNPLKKYILQLLEPDPDKRISISDLMNIVLI